MIAPVMVSRRVVVGGGGHRGEPEIESFAAPLRNQDVSRLEIAMQNLLVVRGFERPWQFGERVSRPPRTRRGRTTACLRRTPSPDIRTHVVDLANVGMIERGDGVSFLLETCVCWPSLAA